MAAGDVIRDYCACCGSSASSWRYRTGVMTQWGFPPLYNQAVAGRYIASGWTGVFPTIRAETNNYYYLKGHGIPALQFHFYGDVVRRRSGATGATVQYMRRMNYVGDAFEPNPPNGFGLTSSLPPSVAAAPWENAAEGAFVNTYIAAGFWRDGVASFSVGQIVLRCIPDAQETTDDWHVTPYLCVLAITGAADPATDTTHFRSFLGNTLLTGSITNDPPLYAGGHHGQEQAGRQSGMILATAGGFGQGFNGVNPIPKGTLLSIGPTFLPNYIAGRDITEGYADLSWCVPFNPLRALCPGEVQTQDNVLCRKTGLRRWRSTSMASSFAGSETNASHTGSLNISLLGAVTGTYPALDDIFTTPAVPTAGGIAVEYVINVTSLAAFAHGVQCTGGDFTGVENGSGGNPHIFHAGDQIRITINRNDEAPPRVEVIIMTCWRTTVAEQFLGIVFRSAPAQSNPLWLGFVEGTVDFTWVKRRGRLAYPAVPAVDTATADFDVLRTSVHALRMSAPALAETDNTFTWREVWIESRRLRASVGGVNVGDSPALENGSLIQQISNSVENTENIALANFTINTVIYDGPSITSRLDILPGGFYYGIRGNVVISDNIFLHGPQTASLRTNNPCNGAQTCQNIMVPAGGLNYGTLDTGLTGIVKTIQQNSPCV